MRSNRTNQVNSDSPGMESRCCKFLFLFDSDFLILMVGSPILRLCRILTDGINVGFDFPKLLRILLDGFERNTGFLMPLFQSGILCVHL